MMFNFMMLMMITSSFILMFNNHPLSAALNLIFFSLNSAFMISYLKLSLWYSHILILIFIGAMMILFIYMISLTPNKKFKLIKPMILFFIMILLLITFLMNSTVFMLPLMINEFFNIQVAKSTKIFNTSSISLTIISMLWLFIMMEIVKNISMENESTIRKKF